jgi:twitching motility protein PilT
VPTLEQLRLPKALSGIAEAERGMVLVTGVTGSGKSSTMAAMIDWINRSMNGHILTLENPIEFLHKDKNCSVTQREIGSDTTDFKMGLRAALRQDPDVIMIGELRDAETIDTALKAAETGHLLMSTLHTPDAVSTVMRMMAMFPPEEQEVVRVRLAESLTAVISQRLLPKKNGKGRAVAAEIMINTPSIKDLILDGSRLGEIKDFIAEGREQYGMQSFDQCLTDLVMNGDVTFETAKAAASNPSDFELKLKMFSRMSQEVKADDIPPEEPAAPAGAPALEGIQTGGLDFLNQ